MRRARIHPPGNKQDAVSGRPPPSEAPSRDVPLGFVADNDKPKLHRQKRAGGDSKPPLPFGVVLCAAASVIVLSVASIFGIYHLASGNPVPSQEVQRIHRRLPADSIYRLSVPDIDGRKVSLSKFAGMVTMVVNVASE